jgi:acetate kinase
MTILAVNTGSSTLKFALYPVHRGKVQAANLTGSFSGLEPQGQASLQWRMQDTLNGTVREGTEPLQASDKGDADHFEAALQRLQALLRELGLAPQLHAIAHRVVHGGTAYHQATVVNDEAMRGLQALSPLAPLHQPHNLMGIALCQRSYPGVPQVACFDTAFHSTLPEVETRFALPEALYAQGIRRYGFHGLSYQYVQGVLQAVSARAQGPVVMAHLGNGASLCATREGRSQATTMGFSAVEGLMMGTRCGALDPGVLLHLLSAGWTAQQLEDLLYRQSGLLGVSGISADMRRLRADPSPQAQGAIALFEHRVLREIGAVAACVQGMGVLAFTGGIGEHDALLRANVCQQLAYLGVALDDAANAQATGADVRGVHAPSSAVEVWVIPTDEGKVAAQAAADVLWPANTTSAS